MTFTKNTLDIPINELIEDAENTETPRQFIRHSEDEFGIDSADIDSMDDEVLNNYINWLDELWNK